MTIPRIYLTAGHQVINGKGTGASSPYGDEAVLALALRDDLAAELRKLGHSVITDPPSDPLRVVLRWLRSVVSSKDILIDIHFNSAANPEANGTEVIIPSSYTAREVELGRYLAASIADALGTRLRRGKMIYPGVKTEDETQHKTIGILRGPFQPANALIETGFLSNYGDMEKYWAGRPKLIRNLTTAIDDFMAGRKTIYSAA